MDDDGFCLTGQGGDTYRCSRLLLATGMIDLLPAIRDAVGPDYPLIFDSGVRSGTDVLRAIALGADFVMLGRAFHYGIGALGAAGAPQVAHILRAGMKADMGQMAITRPTQVRGRIVNRKG